MPVIERLQFANTALAAVAGWRSGANLSASRAGGKPTFDDEDKHRFRVTPGG